MPLRLSACAIVGTLAILAAPARAQTVATWLGGAGIWSDPTRWSSDPLQPCNGNGGETFDVVLSSGTPTLDLDCTVEAFDLSGGILEGGFELTTSQLLT